MIKMQDIWTSLVIIPLTILIVGIVSLSIASVDKEVNKIQCSDNYKLILQCWEKWCENTCYPVWIQPKEEYMCKY